MARGSLKDQFKKTGQQIGSTAGAALGTLIPIPGVGTAIGGAVGGLIGGLFDKDKKQRQVGPSEAELQMQERMKQYEQSQFVGTNPYDAMSVDLQAAEFQRQQQAQEQADILASLQGGASGAGAAALATSLMRSSSQKQRQVAADISKQEQQIKMQKAAADVQLQQERQRFEQGKLETLLGIDMGRVTAEEQARLAEEQGKMDRRSQLLGGVMDLGGTVLSAGLSDGGFLNPK